MYSIGTGSVIYNPSQDLLDAFKSWEILADCVICRSSIWDERTVIIICKTHKIAWDIVMKESDTIMHVYNDEDILNYT